MKIEPKKCRIGQVHIYNRAEVKYSNIQIFVRWFSNLNSALCYSFSFSYALFMTFFSFFSSLNIQIFVWKPNKYLKPDIIHLSQP